MRMHRPRVARSTLLCSSLVVALACRSEPSVAAEMPRSTGHAVPPHSTTDVTSEPRTTTQTPESEPAAEPRGEAIAEKRAPEITRERVSSAGKPATQVNVPRTQHVWAELPDALQRLLDDDPRMQPWVNHVIEVADRCYAKTRTGNASAHGILVLQLTMHENARPSVDIELLPGSLTGVVTCATRELMGRRSPLFTSREGERHRLELHFQP
jgi:hypothetical protein